MTDQHPDERDAERLRFDIFRSIDRLRLSTWLTVVFERLWPLVLPLLLVIAAVPLPVLVRHFPDDSGYPAACRSRACLLSRFPPASTFCLKFRLPGHTEISQRLESVNTLDHQPITVQSEELATKPDDPFAQALVERTPQTHGRAYPEFEERIAANAYPGT